MKPSERRLQPTRAHLLPTEQASAVQDPADEQILRIRRIGKSLFETADCVVAYGDGFSGFPTGASMNSVEAAFCYSVPTPIGLKVVNDTRNDKSLNKHPSVTDAPHIRFYATHPVRNPDGAIIGSISLIDYAPRAFGPEDRQLLIDLAALVDRELYLRSINASQLVLEKKNKSLRRKSLIDPLLGTWNRGAIMRILTIEAIRCEKLNMPLSLIVADLDYFKKINDTYGHPAGDDVLVKVASRLRSCIRPQEALGRYGGEEFLVVLPGACEKTAMAMAERMRIAVASHPETIGDASISLSISAGIASTALFPAASTEELISRADVALYAAKDAGRNRVIQATPD